MSCTYSVSRVATPTQSTSTPVASGSSVPVWPMRVPRGNQRCARSTASREVMPPGLSSTSKPCHAAAFMSPTSPYQSHRACSITQRGNLSNERRGAAGVGAMAAQQCVIYNPTAGYGRAKHHLDSLRRALEKDAEFLPTRGPGHAEELALAAARVGVPLVGAAGGDGTIHEVANGLLRAERPEAALAVYPLGSANDYAHSLGLTAG